jgi:hypothetical protein
VGQKLTRSIKFVAATLAIYLLAVPLWASGVVPGKELSAA